MECPWQRVCAEHSQQRAEQAPGLGRRREKRLHRRVLLDLRADMPGETGGIALPGLRQELREPSATARQLHGLRRCRTRLVPSAGRARRGKRPGFISRVERGETFADAADVVVDAPDFAGRNPAAEDAENEKTERVDGV